MYLEKFKLDGKTAVVTGGGQGIGLACVEALAEAGARVVIADRDTKVAGQRQAELKAKGYDTEVVDHGRHRFRRGRRRSPTISSPATARSTSSSTMPASPAAKRRPRPSPTSIGSTSSTSISTAPSGAAARSASTCCRPRAGAIVNIGSMSGFIVNKPQEQCYYNASKAAVHHLTKSLAAEWGARGVRVNAVAPTYIETPLNAFVKSNPRMYDAWIGGTPMARMGQVEEIASVVLFLASDAASLMTGSIVLVDGGYTCW